MSGVESQLRHLADAQGIWRVGFADLTAPAARRLVLEQGGDWLVSFPRAVSLVVRLQDSLVDLLPGRHVEPGVARLYDIHVYGAIGAQLDGTSTRVAALLQETGYQALSVPASSSLDGGSNVGLVSHKLVARLAGLGWIGRSALFVTPEHGPRVRLATVLTDAPLSTGEPTALNCGSCRVCVNRCPASAITGRAFSPEDPLEARFLPEVCDAYRQGMRDKTTVPTCGVCVAVCPQGRA